MSIIEYRADVMKRGFVITEKASIYNHNGVPSPTGEGFVSVLVEIMDTDGLVWGGDKMIPMEMYLRDEDHTVELRNMVNALSNSMHTRHATNPNHCQHDIVNLNGKVRCKKCMAKLGEEIYVSLRWN